MSDPVIQSQFWAAVGEGDCEKVRELAGAGADLDCPMGSAGGEPPLIRAVTMNDAEMLKILIHLGANVNCRCGLPGNWTPVMSAHDHPETLRILIDAGADINARTASYCMREPSGRVVRQPGGKTALHLAAAAGNAASVRALIAARAEVETRAEDGLAPLDFAIQLGTTNEAAVALVEAGAQLTPGRLELVHSSAHRPDSDLLAFPGLVGPEIHSARSELQPAYHPDANQQTNPSEARCPNCHALLYSRRSKLCGKCGSLIPADLQLTDEQVQVREDSRQWARDLAERFSGHAAVGHNSPSPDLVQATPTIQTRELLQRVSCAEEYRHRHRPDFWLYATGYGFIAFILGYVSFISAALPPGGTVPLFVLLAFFCYRSWHRASPICPNCKKNIRLCAHEFCHVCGQPVVNGRCRGCGLDLPRRFSFLPFRSDCSWVWITYCPGCGVYLAAKTGRPRVSRGP